MTSMDLQEDDFRPSAARLVESLRDTGYSEKAAFADIVDNSIAANATKISIELQYLMGEFRVIITDNGEGMTDAELKMPCAMAPTSVLTRNRLASSAWA